jgi:hypothetical protein
MGNQALQFSFNQKRKQGGFEQEEIDLFKSFGYLGKNSRMFIRPTAAWTASSSATF